MNDLPDASCFADAVRTAARSAPVPPRRRLLGAVGGLGAAIAGSLLLPGCAGFPGREPMRVSLVGLEPMPGQGLEWRFLVKLRVLNPNASPVDYEGGFVAMSLRGSEVAAGVLGEGGRLPGYGDTVVTIPMSVTALGVIRPLLGLAAGAAGGDPPPLTYALRGSLSSGAFGRVPFAMTGELDMRSLFGRPSSR